MRRARVRSVPRWLARLVALACVLAVVTAFFAQGRRYFVCAMDGGVHFDPCCADEVPGTDQDASDVPCCARRDLPVLPAVAPTPIAPSLDPSLVPPAPELTVLSAPPFAVFDESLVPPPAMRSRAGPAPPPTSAERLSLLSVLRS